MTIDELETAMGEKAFVTLLKHKGGLRLYVPKQMHADHMIAILVGIDAALALAELAGGEFVDLPTLARYDRQAQRERIVGLRKKGLSIDMVAWECKCARRYVSQVCREHREEIDREIPGPRMRQMELPIFAGAR